MQPISWLNVRDLFGFTKPADELDSDEWERPPAEHSSISEVYEIRTEIVEVPAPAPRWTSEPPVRPGVYWVRIPPDGPARVVEIVRMNGVLIAAWPGVNDFTVQGCGHEFSTSPIVEPVEP